VGKEVYSRGKDGSRYAGHVLVGGKKKKRVAMSQKRRSQKRELLSERAKGKKPGILPAEVSGKGKRDSKRCSKLEREKKNGNP